MFLNLKKINKIFILAIILLFSCNKEIDDNFFANKENVIQNDGFFPLSPDNSWVYENRLGTLQPDGSYKYSGEVIKSEYTINKINKVETNGSYRFDYGFSPLDLGKVLGGFIGSLDQVIKVNDEYKKKSIIKAEYIDEEGVTKNRLEYEINDNIFLTDKELPNSTIFSVKTGKIGESYNIINEKGRDTIINTGIHIDYTIENIFIEKLSQLPNNLCNQPGIDDHLKDFKEVIHTRERLTINKMVSYSDGGIIINGKVKAGIPGAEDGEEYLSYMRGNMKLENAGISGGLDLDGVGLIGFPINAPNSNINSGDLDLVNLTSDLTICPASAEINFDGEPSKASKIEILSNQTLYTVDNYWVKGVGNIKSITSPSVLNAEINLIEGSMTPTSIDVIPEDPNCANEIDKGKAKFELNLKSNPQNFIIKYPFTIDNRSIIQNLRNHTIRKTLN